MKIFKSNSGFSIMEVMIAAGLLGVVTVGVMQITKNMTKSSKTDAQRVEFTQLASQIQSILRDEYSCEATLLGTSPSGAGTEITEIKRKKSDGTESVVFQTGNSYGASTNPIFLKSMKIKNYNPSSGIADFVVEMNKGRKDYDTMTKVEKDTILSTSYGLAIVPKTIKMQVILDDSGNIKDCLSDKDDYTSGTCGMFDGDWSDKVKCKSVKIASNGVSPAITAEGSLAVRKGLMVGSTLTTEPIDGSAVILKDLEVQDNFIVKNNSTITSGKIIFTDGDASIKQVSGRNLYLQNNTGTSGANVIIGTETSARTTITPSALAINKVGPPTGAVTLEINGDTVLIPSGSATVKITFGNSNARIEYNGTDITFFGSAGGKVKYKDGLSDEEVSSRGFVNKQIASVVTGDPATLNAILAEVLGAASSSGLDAINRDMCLSTANMTWTGTQCVSKSNDKCTGNKRVYGWSNGVLDCRDIVYPNQTCNPGFIYTGHNASGDKICQSGDYQLGAWVQEKIDAALSAERAKTVCTGGVKSGLCVVNGTSCPSGTSRVGNWGSTSSVKVCGGSTTGCNTCKYSCYTGGHSFSNTATEICCAGKVAACGPATSGQTCGNATLTQVGCTMP